MTDGQTNEWTDTFAVANTALYSFARQKNTECVLERQKQVDSNGFSTMHGASAPSSQDWWVVAAATDCRPQVRSGRLLSIIHALPVVQPTHKGRRVPNTPRLSVTHRHRPPLHRLTMLQWHCIVAMRRWIDTLHSLDHMKNCQPYTLMSLQKLKKFISYNVTYWACSAGKD